MKMISFFLALIAALCIFSVDVMAGRQFSDWSDEGSGGGPLSIISESASFGFGESEAPPPAPAEEEVPIIEAEGEIPVLPEEEYQEDDYTEKEEPEIPDEPIDEYSLNIEDEPYVDMLEEGAGTDEYLPDDKEDDYYKKKIKHQWEIEGDNGRQ